MCVREREREVVVFSEGKVMKILKDIKSEKLGRLGDITGFFFFLKKDGVSVILFFRR